MSNRDPAEALILQLLEWIADRPRSYAEVIEVWRTSCPRLTIWEDACANGFIDYDPQVGKVVSVSRKGQELLDRGNRTTASGRHATTSG